jgi:6-phosphogluconate dehydrogenase
MQARAGASVHHELIHQKEFEMQIGMIGMGRMGANMAKRLAQGGHHCVVFDVKEDSVLGLLESNIIGTKSLDELIGKLEQPRVVWLMVPAAVVEENLRKLAELLDKGDIIIDGGNSHYHDDIRRGKELSRKGIHYLDVGTSGGTAGLERGYCLMIGGEGAIAEYLTPIFTTLAFGSSIDSTTHGKIKPNSTAEQGYLHCGPLGAGHFVKMVHNGIEYGIMGAYAEGLNLLRHANVGRVMTEANAETTPLRDPEHYQYEMNLPEITELWRHGSVISSWLLDITASALHDDPQLKGFSGRVSDSGEGRWAVIAAIDEAVPVPILSAALFARFSSRGDADFADKILSAMRRGFGGHIEMPPE